MLLPPMLQGTVQAMNICYDLEHRITPSARKFNWRKRKAERSIGEIDAEGARRACAKSRGLQTKTVGTTGTSVAGLNCGTILFAVEVGSVVWGKSIP